MRRNCQIRHASLFDIATSNCSFSMVCSTECVYSFCTEGNLSAWNFFSAASLFVVHAPTTNSSHPTRTNILRWLPPSVDLSESFRHSELGVVFVDSSENDSKGFRDELLSSSFAAPNVAIHQETTRKMSSQGQLRRFSIFLVRNIDDFMEIYAKLSPNSFKFSGFYLLVLMKGECLKLDDIFSRFWKIKIYTRRSV